jgi:hypothetical protein
MERRLGDVLEAIDLLREPMIKSGDGADRS